MKTTRAELQKYFEAPLPAVSVIAEAFTFHCFEIEEVEGDTLDIKVLPNRAEDCKTAEGVAAELSSILDLPLKNPAKPEYAKAPTVHTSLTEINNRLGTSFSKQEVEEVFRRLRFDVSMKGEVFAIRAPAPRADIQIPEDIAEEVGRILGYDRVPSSELPASKRPVDQDRYRGMERMKDQLVEQGFTEVLTQSFAKKGAITLANPLDTTKPMLRTSLEENLQEALAKAKLYAPRVLPPNTKPKLFEVGAVFPKEGEYAELRMTERVSAWGDAVGTVDNLSKANLESYGKEYVPKRYVLGAFKPFSSYPFITRDIALWVPSGTKPETVEQTIRKEGGPLLVRLDRFDEFTKEGRTSYAFRLIFESMERTLTDKEVNTSMERITKALAALGYEVR